MSNNDSNNPATDHDCQRFPGLARYGSNIPRMASRLMAIISSAGSETGGRIGDSDINSTMDVFMAPVADLVYLLDREFRSRPSPR